MHTILILFLVSCSGNKDPDPIAEEGCGENQWQDGDECVDYVDEVCDDAIDNDGNGAVDCSDDACQGSLSCPTEYTLTLDMELTYAALGTGSDFEDAEESPAVLLEAAVAVTGTEEGGDWSLSCTGTLSGTAYGAEVWSDNSGGLSFHSDDKTMGTVLSWTLSGSDTNVQWEEDCIVSLPDFTLALKHGSKSIYLQDEAGAWQEGFMGGSMEQTKSKTATVTRWQNLPLANPISWTTVY
jgi:hypothetical protein